MIGTGIEFGLAVAHSTLSAVDFTADDWFDTGGLSGFIELDGAVHVAVIGECQSRHAHRFCFGDEIWNARETIEEAVLGVYVQMSKIH